MKSPITGKEMSVGKELRDMTYRKEPYSVWFHYFQCEDTKEKFEDEHFSALNYNQVVNQYRVRYRIPFPEQIREIRLRYDLSAKMISEILGFGANSWRNYEAGEVPSKANANLIHMISKPETFEECIKQYKDVSEKERTRVLHHILKLKTDSCYCHDPLCRFNIQPDITTGFKAFDKDKVKQVIIYFAERLQPYKTKLNKLLFYVDFVHFRNTAQGITGLCYKADSYGPVPNNYNILFWSLADLGIIDIESSMINNGEVERIIPSPKYQFDASLFSESELGVLEYVTNTFNQTSASDIVEISHRESAWKDNFEGKKIIPFTYAFGLETA
jgi:uncharacterized phage-associated protein